MWYQNLGQRDSEYYFRVPNKRAYVLYVYTPYLVLTKLPLCTFFFRSAYWFIFSDYLSIFVKYSCQIWKIFAKTRFIFFKLKQSLIMNKSTIFHPAFFLVFWAKFHHARLFGSTRFFGTLEYADKDYGLFNFKKERIRLNSWKRLVLIWFWNGQVLWYHRKVCASKWGLNMNGFCAASWVLKNQIRAYLKKKTICSEWKDFLTHSQIKKSSNSVFIQFLKRTYLKTFPRDHQFCNITNILCFKSWLNPNQLLLNSRILSFVSFSKQSK